VLRAAKSPKGPACKTSHSKQNGQKREIWSRLARVVREREKGGANEQGCQQKKSWKNIFKANISLPVATDPFGGLIQNSRNNNITILDHLATLAATSSAASKAEERRVAGCRTTFEGIRAVKFRKEIDK
jgi:hypothetical protein